MLGSGSSASGKAAVPWEGGREEAKGWDWANEGAEGRDVFARGPEGDAGDWSAMVTRGEDETEARSREGWSKVD